jgi:hypothetical protein
LRPRSPLGPVTSWTGTNGFNLDRTFSADGAGTEVNLSSLANIERNGGSAASDFKIIAVNGGKVDLSGISVFADNVSGVNERIYIEIRDAGSQIDLHNVTDITTANIKIDSTASVDLRALQSFAGGNITFESTNPAAKDLHFASNVSFGTDTLIEVAGSTQALIVGPGTAGSAADGTVTILQDGTLSGVSTIIGGLVNIGTLEHWRQVTPREH